MRLNRAGRLVWTAMVLAGSLAVFALGTAPAHAATTQRSPVVWASGDQSGETVDGASATLKRDEGSIRVRLHTTGLRAGHAYTMWVIVFNEPDYCVGNAAGAPDEGHCGMPDAFNPLAGATHIWGDGLVVGKDGSATFSSRREKGHPGLFPTEPALTNPMGAEVLLVVRDHGPAVEGSDQTTTLNGGCAPVPPGYGSPGTYVCENHQMATFPQP